MHLCTCVSKEGGNGEDTGSETLSLMSYTLRYVSLPDVVRKCQFGLSDLDRGVGTERVRTHKRKYCCQIHVDTLVFVSETVCKKTICDVQFDRLPFLDKSPLFSHSETGCCCCCEN